MIPSRVRSEARTNIPAWVFISGAIALILILFFGWILVGMSSTPTPEAVTQDVPLAH